MRDGESAPRRASETPRLVSLSFPARGAPPAAPATRRARKKTQTLSAWSCHCWTARCAHQYYRGVPPDYLGAKPSRRTQRCGRRSCFGVRNGRGSRASPAPVSGCASSFVTAMTPRGSLLSLWRAPAATSRPRETRHLGVGWPAEVSTVRTVLVELVDRTAVPTSVQL